MTHLAADIIEIPIGWILTGIGLLCATICTLATTFYQFMRSRLEAQDKILSMQEAQIAPERGSEALARLRHGHLPLAVRP